MEKISKNFTKKEAVCPCCGYLVEDQRFIKKLQALRDELALPMKINSWFRCINHNDKKKGKKSSYHLQGRAVDIKCGNSIYRRRIIALGIKYGFGGIGIYKSFIHLDNRDTAELVFLDNRKSISSLG